MELKDSAEEMERIRADMARLCACGKVLADAALVFGQGPVPSPVMVLGEAPGRDEIRLGMPFVGKAGQFLISVLRDVFGLEREAFYITNVVKVWPTIDTKRKKTRKPTTEE